MLASGYNGLLRLNYATSSLLLYPLYHGDPSMNRLGSIYRFTGKEIAREGLIGGRTHLDFVDQNKVKFGTRFYRSNNFVNGFGVLGVAYGGYHTIYSTKVLLSLDNAQDRLSFAAAETTRNLAAIQQMKVASTAYEGFSIKHGLNASRRVNIIGAFSYVGLRASGVSFLWGTSAETLLNYTQTLADPSVKEAWDERQKKNHHRDFVFRKPCFKCWQWIYGTKE